MAARSWSSAGKRTMSLPEFFFERLHAIFTAHFCQAWRRVLRRQARAMTTAAALAAMLFVAIKPCWTSGSGLFDDHFGALVGGVGSDRRSKEI